MSAGYYKIELRPEQKSSVCPVCATVNNHIATASNCAHVAKITARRVVLYYRNFDSKFDPRVTA